MRILLLGLCLGLAGCARVPSGAPEAAPTPVTVSRPVERDIIDYVDFTGRTAAVDSVELRARVWGYLDKVNFKEGALVKKDDVLFEIDPLTYRATLNQAEGNLASAKARVERLDADFARARPLLRRGAISREEYDKVVGDRGEAAASRKALKAAVERAKLDLQYTKVTAPISGRINRYVVTAGNPVQAGDQGGGTLLTTIVSVDPMYACFEVDEYTALRVRRLVREGKSDSPRDGGFPVSLGLANRGGPPAPGDHQLRGQPSQPEDRHHTGARCVPQQGAGPPPRAVPRVRAPIGRPHKAVLVSDRAIDTDQGQKIIYIVNPKNEVVSRPVRLGALHDGLREITDGLKPGERVIVNGLQQVRPGVTVEPKLVDMPVRLAANARKSEKP
jgi:multidrug efflux pump subunit AcrA (membrane-fusion protein)